MKLQELCIDLVEPNPNQPRKTFAGIEELGASIKARGLLQPVTVRPLGDRYQIIAGERRYRACQSIGATTLPCIVVDGLDDESTFINATLENCARKDMKPIEEANAYAAIVAMGKTPDEVAEMVGVATFRVTWRLELLNLAPEYQDLDLPMKVARLMSRMSIDNQRCVMRRYMAGDFKTTPECEKFCNVLIQREAQVVMFGEAELDGFGDDVMRRERAQVNRRKIASAWEKITTIAAAFGPIDETAPEDVADALDGDIDQYLRELRELEAHVRRARLKVETAKAMQP